MASEKPPAPNASELIAAINHPLRRRILRALLKGEAASATDLAHTLDERLGNIAYHMKVLVELKMLYLTGTRQVRGAQERFYRSSLTRKPDWATKALAETKKLDEATTAA